MKRFGRQVFWAGLAFLLPATIVLVWLVFFSLPASIAAYKSLLLVSCLLSVAISSIVLLKTPIRELRLRQQVRKEQQRKWSEDSMEQSSLALLLELCTVSLLMPLVVAGLVAAYCWYAQVMPTRAELRTLTAIVWLATLVVLARVSFGYCLGAKRGSLARP